MLQLAWLLIVVAVSGINAEIPQNDCVDITKHPHVVSILKNGKHVCSGIILNELYILTSDRCVPPFKHVWNVMNDIVVVSGTNTLKPSGQRIISKEMFSQNQHVNPSENPKASGLGIIKLAKPLKFGDKVKPIVISEEENIPPGAKVQTVGFMLATKSKEETTACLEETTLEIVDRQQCQKLYEKTITESEFCSQPLTDSNLCKGEQGNPVIYEGKLVGVTTYGISCKNPPIPDVHPIIFKNLEYLNEIVQNLKI